MKQLVNRVRMFLWKAVMTSSPLSLSVALFIMLAACYVALIPLPRVDNHLLGSDGGYYYSYMRSFWIDHDSDIRNDITIYNSRMSDDNPNRLKVLYDRSIGPAILWSPFFLLARTATLSLRAVGYPIATDGFSWLEEASVCLSSIAYAMVGLYLLLLTVSRYAGSGPARKSVLLMFFSTFAFYYTLFEPSMGHALELFTVSFLLWCVLGRKTDSLRSWVMVGAAGALMTLVRWQNGVFLLLLPFGLLLADSRRASHIVPRCLAAGASLLLLVAIQCLFWKTTLGTLVTVPQGGGFLTPFSPHLAEVLFSPCHGLISWHPIFVFAGAGICLVKPIRLAVLLGALVLLQLYVCSIVSEWWCADAFGMRRMTGAIPMLVFGLAFLIARIDAVAARARQALACLAVVLVVWNVLFMAQYRLGLIPSGSAPTLRQMTAGKIQVFTKGYEYFTKMLPGQGEVPAEKHEEPTH